MSATAALLTAARVVPLAALAPFLGGGLPASLRLALGFGLAAALWPFAAVADAAVEGPLGLLAVKELAVGATLAFVCSLVFWAAASAGRLVESSTGLPRIAHATRLLAVVIFFGVGGHRLVLAAWGQSYEVVPVAAFVSAASLGEAAELAIGLTGQLLAVALGLSAPVLAAVLLADLGASVVVRFAPELAATVSALPLRALAGLGTLAAGSLLLSRALGTAVRDSATATEAVLRVLR